MLKALNYLVAVDRLNKNDKFVITDNNRQMLTDVKNWLARKDGNLDPAKGILFLGEKGTGKTLMIDCITMCLYSFFGYVLTKYNAPYITKNYYAKSDFNDNYPLDYQVHYYRFLAINDIGLERDYRDGSNMIQDILFDRFENRKYTFGTTNLTQAEFYARYDDDKNRMADRYSQMFNYVTLNGDSFRK
jgi:DNA replication protein DnaC